MAKVAYSSTHANAQVARNGYGWGEVFLHLRGAELPPRPDYYRPGATCGCDLSGPDLAVKVEQAQALLRAPGVLPAARLPMPGGRRAGLVADQLRALGLPARVHGPVDPPRFSSDEDEESWEEGDVE